MRSARSLSRSPSRADPGAVPGTRGLSQPRTKRGAAAPCRRPRRPRGRRGAWAGRRSAARRPPGAARSGSWSGAGPAEWRRARWRPEARRAPRWGCPEKRPSAARGLREPGTARAGPGAASSLPHAAPSPSFGVPVAGETRQRREERLPPKCRCLQTQLLRCICNAKDGAANEGRCGRGVPGTGRAGRCPGPSALPAAIVSASCETSRAFGAGLAEPPGSERSAGRGRAAAQRCTVKRPGTGKARPAAPSRGRPLAAWLDGEWRRLRARLWLGGPQPLFPLRGRPSFVLRSRTRGRGIPYSFTSPSHPGKPRLCAAASPHRAFPRASPRVENMHFFCTSSLTAHTC